MPTSLTSTYLLPAVILNPIVILHGINTFLSHMVPPTIAVSTSQHLWLERLGPPATPGPHFNMHSNDQMCWGYTVILVIVQILAYSRVSENRIKRKGARAAKVEREKATKIEREALDSNATTRKISTEPGVELNSNHNAAKEGSMKMKKHVHRQILLSDPAVLTISREADNYQDCISTSETSSEEETIA